MKSTANKALSALLQLDDESLLRQTRYLSEFMLPERAAALERTLAMRTRYMCLCAENTFHPQNASALIRTCEAFGIQDLYTVEEVCRFSPNTRIVRGTDKWIDIRSFDSTTGMLQGLHEKGYRIVATSPHAGDFTPENFDVTAGPFALVFGTEHEGISEQVKNSADAFIQIPMCGFVESLNVSASAAILLYTLTTRLRASEVSWRLSEREHAELLARWMFSSLKDAPNILKRYSESAEAPLTPTR